MSVPRRPAARMTTATAVVRYVWEHPSNAGHRPRALLRLAGYQARARLLRRRAVARLGERSRLWVDLHRTGASMVMYANPPDLPEMLAWRRALRDGELFVDVGAYTIWAAELGAEVIALEPAADTFDAASPARLPRLPRLPLAPGCPGPAGLMRPGRPGCPRLGLGRGGS